MLSSTDRFFQAPATEHVTVPWLKHQIPLHSNTQLPIFCFPPTQHVERGEELSTKPKRQQRSDTQVEEDKRFSGLTAAPFSPLYIASNPGRMKHELEMNFVSSLCILDMCFSTEFNMWASAVFKDKPVLKMGVIVGQNDASNTTQE